MRFDIIMNDNGEYISSSKLLQQYIVSEIYLFAVSNYP